jgi:hypothetical protein
MVVNVKLPVPAHSNKRGAKQDVFGKLKRFHDMFRSVFIMRTHGTLYEKHGMYYA